MTSLTFVNVRFDSSEYLATVPLDDGRVEVKTVAAVGADSTSRARKQNSAAADERRPAADDDKFYLTEEVTS